MSKKSTPPPTPPEPMHGAARVGHDHDCNEIEKVTKLPHRGGAILAGSPDVEINGKDAARGGDPLLCEGSPRQDFIVTGSGSVEINGRPAARVTDKTMHRAPGVITARGQLDHDVEIGGPTVGAIVGDPESARKECERAKEGRASKSGEQSFDNCGLEATRQIMNKGRSVPISEADLFWGALRDHNASTGPVPRKQGGTTGAQRLRVLQSQHINSRYVNTTQVSDLVQPLAERKGVITSHDMSKFGLSAGSGGGHALLPTGVEYDKDGNPARVYYNDTGQGGHGCMKSMSVKDFEGSMLPKDKVNINVTNDPIW